MKEYLRKIMKNNLKKQMRTIRLELKITTDESQKILLRKILKELKKEEKAQGIKIEKQFEQVLQSA